jgi:hypothetical protein
MVAKEGRKGPEFQKCGRILEARTCVHDPVSQLGKGLLANIPKLEQDTVETLVQTAFAAMVTHA